MATNGGFDAAIIRGLENDKVQSIGGGSGKYSKSELTLYIKLLLVVSTMSCQNILLFFVYFCYQMDCQF